MHTSKVSTWSVHTRFPATASYWSGWKGHETHSADEAYGQRSQFSAARSQFSAVSSAQSATSSPTVVVMNKESGIIGLRSDATGQA